MFTVGIKEIYALLIITLVMTTAGSVINVYTNYKIISQQEQQIKDLINHSAQVDEHINATNTTLEIIQNAQIDQVPILDTFATHVNQTATAAPQVFENKKLLEQIHEAVVVNNSKGNVTE